MSEIRPTFAGEMQLAGWSESHTGGCKVTFWLQSPDDLAAFRTLTTRKGNTAGHRFMAALVEVGDDEMPTQGGGVSPPPQEKPKGGPLSKLAAMWCQDPEFWTWLETDPLNSAKSERGAAACIYALCEIESRAELDNDADAAEKFHRLIRGPYSKYILARGGK